MSIKVYSLSANEWVEAMQSSRDYLDIFAFTYTVTINLVKYIEEKCGGWEPYVRRFQKYGRSYLYGRELLHSNKLSRDKIFDFVDNNRGGFNSWMYMVEDDYILEVIKDSNRSIMDFKDCWFKKNDDMFITICCDFIGGLTYKLLKFVEVNEV